MSAVAINSAVVVTSPVIERHYTPDELGEMWNLSADTVRRLFEREPGVLVIERQRSHLVRRYRSLRIPQSVAERVHKRMTNPAGHCDSDSNFCLLLRPRRLNPGA
jgi:hypothetical protein